METKPLEIEGTWEQISALAPAFSGRRLRLTVFPLEENGKTSENGPSLDEQLDAIAGSIPPAEWAKLPSDLLDNLDHYIYGTPKQ